MLPFSCLELFISEMRRLGEIVDIMSHECYLLTHCTVLVLRTFRIFTGAKMTILTTFSTTFSIGGLIIRQVPSKPLLKIVLILYLEDSYKASRTSLNSHMQI